MLSAYGNQFRRSLASPVAWLLLTAGVALVEYYAGENVNLGSLYLIPVIVVAWHGPLHWALAASLAFPLVRFAYFASGHWTPPEQMVHVAITTSVRVATMVLIAYLVHRTRRIGELERELRNLEGLLPICTYCKQIQDESGQWHSVEQYIGTRTSAEFTHRICQVCEGGHRKAFLG